MVLTLLNKHQKQWQSLVEKNLKKQEDLCFQHFQIKQKKIIDYKLQQILYYKWLKRLDEYYEIMREPNINEKELLKKFEEDT